MRTLIVAAHADDETLGAASILLGHPRETWILHGTDSAPLNLEYAHRAGFATRAEYAAARRQELLAAMQAAGVPASHCLALDIPDQEATRQIDAIVQAIRHYYAEFHIDRTLTHAYEGGHPDHDALACAAQRSGVANVWEMPLYHAFGGSFVTQTPLPQPGAEPPMIVVLTETERTRKRAMLGCFPSQGEVVARFETSHEVFRRQPLYDFTKPPHEGTLYYEGRRLGWRGEDWRSTAAQVSVR